MSALEAVFAGRRKRKRAAFIAYLTAGDPDLETTGSLLHALVAGGADVIEVGVPFSDPIADGPVNQRAARRALQSGTRLAGILRLVAREREQLGVPIVLFTYLNPLLAYGLGRFAEQAADSGIDGVLCVDLPPEEAEGYRVALGERGVDTVFLLAPTSGKDRVRLVARASRGFIYYVSRTGVTGVQGELPEELLREAKRLRRKLPLPLAVGFGISTPEQVEQVAKVADGVVVGSALVRLVEEHGADREALPGLLEDEVARLCAPLR